MTKKQKALAEQIKAKLIKEQENGDTELAHINADDYLCDLLTALGFEDVVDAYNDIYKWHA